MSLIRNDSVRHRHELVTLARPGTPRFRLLVACFLLSCGGVSIERASAVAAVRLRLPTSSDHVIQVQPDTIVTLHAQVLVWNPAKLSAYQLTVDSSGYTSGSAGSLSPVGWPGNPSAGASILTGRPDHVFVPVPSSPAVDTSTLNYVFSSSVAGVDSQVYTITPI